LIGVLRLVMAVPFVLVAAVVGVVGVTIVGAGEVFRLLAETICPELK
jgi:hypothetical protein